MVISRSYWIKSHNAVTRKSPSSLEHYEKSVNLTRIRHVNSQLDVVIDVVKSFNT